jgi:NAD+ kinase
MSEIPFRRVAVVVHPARKIDRALAMLKAWTEAQGRELVQLEVAGSRPAVATPGTVGSADIVVALGGDGTVLGALRAGAPTHTPVLGVACGSLGALSAVTAEELPSALDRFRAGDWTVRSLPVLSINSDAGGGVGGQRLRGLPPRRRPGRGARHARR